MAVLNLCAIGFCRRPYRVVELASKFRKAGLQGFRVMRIAGSMMLLMFDDDKMRHELLASGKLDEWLESVGTWSSMMLIHNRRTRLSISGLLIETDWRFHIDEDLELRVGEQCFPIRVTEIEEAIGPKCDCSCELMEESEFSGKHDKKEDAKERIDASAVKGRDSGNNSVGSVVPNSISLKAMNSLERDEEVRYSDVPAECGLREEIQVRASEDVVVNNPTSRGPSNRITLAEVIEYRGQQRKRDGNDYLVLKMREMKRVLKEWNRDSFGNIDAQYREIIGEIEVLDARLNSDELGSNDLQHKRELYSRLWAVSRLCESIWRQKSKAIWLAEGDRNTQFFHRQARIKLV
ncbi:hypothetical protein V6N12_046097 [Hibiscus sabdariffa]|uniref:DUF4283 domain-containing protein n=1 Tax=Hibiscus sabdariffa TaxID=183260 RepID=A0ABR2G4S1_9ROSI